MNDFCRKYIEIINGELKGLNLTRINDPEDFYNKQYLDSILPKEQCVRFKEAIENSKLVVDLGFGGGFPILPLAYENKNIQFIGIEARRKKVIAVKNIAESMGIDNIKLYHERIENILFDRQAVITVRAVGKINEVLGKINATEEVLVFFYKGPNFCSIEDPKYFDNNWDLIEDAIVGIPKTTGRRIVCFRNVPRGTDVNHKKSLVKLSELL